jgi:hypothetical protein
MRNSPPPPLKPTAVLMRAAAAARWAQVSKSTWHHWAAIGRVPPGIKLSPGVTVWDMAAVTAALMNGEAR